MNAEGAEADVRSHGGRSRMMAGLFVRRTPSVSSRRMFVLGFGLMALIGAMMISIAIGPVFYSLNTVWDSLQSSDTTATSNIVRDVRLPRVLLSALIGASLAMSGVILQGVTRNPLADPHIFGISAGAGLVAVSATILLPDLPKGYMQPMAFAGGLVGGGMAYALGWRGGVSPLRLALVGIAVTSILIAITSGVLVTSDVTAQGSLRWLIGGLTPGNWNDFELMLPYFAFGMVLTLAMMRQLNVISSGDELATSLGQHVERTRFILAATAALLASAAVSIAGLVGFLGLIVPHVVRLVIGNDYRFVLPASAIFGALLLVVADTAARTVLDPQELPVGILTAVMGGPVFILLVRSRA